MAEKFSFAACAGLIALAVTAWGSSAQAQGEQQNAPVRVRGAIERVDGATLTVKSREGPTLTIKLDDNATVSAVVKASLSDIKSGTFVGIAATPQANGPLRAVEVLIFPEALRGTGEGHYAWDLLPESTMTNATVAETVSQVNGPILTLKYKDGEQKIFVPPDVPVVTFAPSNRDELKPGGKIFIARAMRQPDGTLHTARISIGRGIDPPM